MNTLMKRHEVSATGFSLVAEIQSMTDATCHLKGLKQVLHMMEEDRSELEADDNMCTHIGHCVKLANQCIQSQIPSLLMHTVLHTLCSSLLEFSRK